MRPAPPAGPVVRAASLALLAAGLLACASDPPPRAPSTTYGGERPATLAVPPILAPGARYPLVLVLHGYGASGAVQSWYFGLGGLAGDPGAFVLAPDGTPDAGGSRFWNASPACCDFGGAGVDDVAYLGRLLDDVMAEWPVDPSRVVVIGHSNGGFMAYRLACERADVVTGIAGLAGAMVSGGLSCAPSERVSVLHVHGDADGTIAYAGGTILGVAHPGAVASAEAWAALDGCAATWTPGAPVDFDAGLAGAETLTRAADGCPAGAAVELWTIPGGAHVPALQPGAGRAMVDWLLAHPRP